MRASISDRIARDQRPEIHLREDVALDVDAGRDLDQLQPVGPQGEDAALGDVEHALPALAPHRRR